MESRDGLQLPLSNGSKVGLQSLLRRPEEPPMNSPRSIVSPGTLARGRRCAVLRAIAQIYRFVRLGQDVPAGTRTDDWICAAPSNAVGSSSATPG